MYLKRTGFPVPAFTIRIVVHNRAVFQGAHTSISYAFFKLKYHGRQLCLLSVTLVYTYFFQRLQKPRCKGRGIVISGCRLNTIYCVVIDGGASEEQLLDQGK